MPRLDHEVSVSSVVAFVPRSSTAPTVITNGSLAGAKSTASAASPWLPAAATTTTPRAHTASTAASSGSSR
jgi:hypothetical protein